MHKIAKKIAKKCIKLQKKMLKILKISEKFLKKIFFESRDTHSIYGYAEFCVSVFFETLTKEDELVSLYHPDLQKSFKILEEIFYLIGNFWFLIEAVFLQYQISMNVFGAENTLKMRQLACVGWGIPTLFIIPWLVLVDRRYNMEHAAHKEDFHFSRGKIRVTSQNDCLFSNFFRKTKKKQTNTKLL